MKDEEDGGCDQFSKGVAGTWFYSTEKKKHHLEFNQVCEK